FLCDVIIINIITFINIIERVIFESRNINSDCKKSQASKKKKRKARSK
ncbi:hypothetical protein M5D96_008489, partial [Drosophila gunungcola]